MLLPGLGSAARRLWRDRGATSVAVLVLAVGLGANIAMFALVDGVLLRPLGFPHPEQLVSIREIIPQASRQFPTLPVNWSSFDQWRQDSQLLAGLSLVHPAAMVMTAQGEARDVLVDQVSANLFPLLGVRPALGRGFLPDDDQAGRNHSVVLTDAFWHRQFGGDPAALGRSISLDGQICQIVGVLPGDFHFVRGSEWGTFTAAASAAGAPQMFQPLVVAADKRAVVGNFDFGVVARLRPGVSAAAAETELSAITARMVAATRQPGFSVLAEVRGLRQQIIGNSGTRLWLLLAAVAGVLVLVVFNVANLLLLRAQARAMEAALRLALGASRARLAGSALAEAFWLALASCGLGWALAAVAIRGLAHSPVAGLPRLAQVQVGTAATTFGLGLAALTCAASAWWPAWHWARTPPQAALRGSSTGLVAGGRSWFSQLLLAGQAALAMLLLALTGLLLHSSYQMDQIPVGFATGPKLIVAADLPGPDDVRRAFWTALVPRLDALPGVTAAGLTTELPLLGTGYTTQLFLDGDTRPVPERPVANFQFVSPGYFAAMGIRVRGRELQPSDLATDAPPVAVISRATALRVWPGQLALGRRFHPSAANGPLVTVVGISEDVRTALGRAAGPMVFQPLTEDLQRHLAYAVVRPAPGIGPLTLAPAVRALMQQLQPAAAVPTIETMDQVRASTVAPQRFQLDVTLSFGLFALLLASLGLYGMVAFSVARSRRELGIRRCLGAEGRTLVAWQFRRGMTPVFTGVLVGLGGALLVAPLLASQLYGISPRDPLALGLSALALLGAAALACLLPARRAAGVDPLQVLRMQ